MAAEAGNNRMRLKIPGGALLSNRHVSAISMAQLIRILGRSQSWIFIPVYLSVIRHVPYIQIGLLFFGTALLSLPFSIYGGNLIDRLGRRMAAVWLPPIIMALLLFMAFSIYFHSSLYFIYSAFLLVEPFTSIQGILDNVVITDTTDEKQRTDAFSMVRIAGNLGFSVGPALGGFLSQISYFYVFLFPAVLTAGEWLLYIRYVSETKTDFSVRTGNFEFPWRDTKFVILSLLVASMWFVAGQWGTTLTLFWTNIDRVPNYMIGILYSVNGLAVVFLQMPVNWVLARMRDFNRIALGGAIYSVGFFVLAFFSGFPFLIADVVFLTIGENVMSPVTYSLIGKISPAEKRGQYFGAFQLLLGLIAPMAPVLGTGLLSRFSSDPLLVWLPILVIGISMSFLVSRVGMIMRSERKPASYETKL